MTGKLSLLFCAAWMAAAQEATSGFELRATIAATTAYSRQLSSPPRLGSSVAAGGRAMLYPTWKIDSNWAAFAAIQLHTRPYFFEEFTTQGHGARASILQAHLSYSKFRADRSIVVRVGQLSSAFGSFLLRYDDAVNPLIDMPLLYGYYYKGVTTLGLTGVEVTATAGRFDARAQFVNSSPANRRGLFDREQYGSWAGGGGITIRQGFRAGVSAYRGPYLHRQYRFYFPGEADPRELPGTAAGVDVEWGRGPWNAYGEWQKYRFEYRAIPDFTQHAGYGELRRVLHPRVFVASRVGYLRTSAAPGRQVYEFAAGYRVSASQLVKAGYQVQQGPAYPGAVGNTFAIQFVTAFRPISIARD